METSRAQSTAGEGIGVAGEIANDSPAQPITFRETSVTLTVPPEMTGAFNDTRTWFAYFPTEHDPRPNADEYADLTLQPKNTYQVFWTPNDSRPHQPPKGAASSRELGHNSATSRPSSSPS